jgi:hypothetical protein
MYFHQTVSHTFKIYFHLFLTLCKLFKEKYKHGKHSERDEVTYRTTLTRLLTLT